MENGKNLLAKNNLNLKSGDLIKLETGNYILNSNDIEAIKMIQSSIRNESDLNKIVEKLYLTTIEKKILTDENKKLKERISIAEQKIFKLLGEEGKAIGYQANDELKNFKNEYEKIKEKGDYKKTESYLNRIFKKFEFGIELRFRKKYNYLLEFSEKGDESLKSVVHEKLIEINNKEPKSERYKLLEILYKAALACENK